MYTKCMHVCFLSEHFHKSPSGPRKACTKLAEAMLGLGHRVSLIGIAPKTEDQPWTGSRPARLHKYSWKLVPVKIGRQRFYARELSALHKEEKIDVVLAMGLEAGAAALRFRAKHGVPFVLNPRSYLAEPIGHPKYKLAKKLTEQCNAFVALSNSACIAWYWRFGASVPQNAFGVLNGCDPREHEGEIEPLPDVKLQPGVPLLLSVGMLRRPKGHHVVLRALAELRNEPWQLVIAGEGPARAELERDIVRHGLVGRVHLPGIVEGPRLRWLYRNATFFVLFPLYFEVCGNAFLEAMAAGLPVIASEAGAISEVVHSPLNPTGKLVRLKGQPDVDEGAVVGDLVEALQAALNSKQRRQQAAASLYRAKELTWGLCAQGYLGACKFALVHKPSVPRYDRSPMVAAWGV